jgi:hypothetical protein
MADEPISMAHFINPSQQSVCLYAYLRIVARQRLGEKVTAAMITHATIKEFLDASFYMLSVSYQMKGGNQFFPEFILKILCNIMIKRHTYCYKILWRLQ